MKQLILLVAIFLMSATGHAEPRVVSVGKEISQTSLFNFQALQELSHHSDQVWNQIVREKGSIAAAQASLTDFKKLDPRIIEIHTALAQMIESSRFDEEHFLVVYGSSIQGPSYQNITGERLSPLLRYVARSLSTGLAVLMFEKMDSAWTFVPTNILVGDIIDCAIKNCDQSKYKSVNPQYRRPNFSEQMLKYGKVYFYADVIATSDYDSEFNCDYFIYPTWQYAMVDALSDIQYRNPKTLEESSLLFRCEHATRPRDVDYESYETNRAKKYTQLQEMQALVLKVTKAYVKKAF
ncbi:hypothetical protein [Bdellovibrio sp. HCB2-146]|uniref:hypothetical protein n=1 Tax=Bdellovibrio sp. HCB2-146 TaxID=3394362 RepID=UPI0039BC9A5C